MNKEFESIFVHNVFWVRQTQVEEKLQATQGKIEKLAREKGEGGFRMIVFLKRLFIVTPLMLPFILVDSLGLILFQKELTYKNFVIYKWCIGVGGYDDQ